MPFQPLTPATRSASPAVIEPRALFGVEFRCVYIHDDGEVCGHRCDEHGYFCVAHVNTRIENDTMYMGGARLVPRPKGCGFRGTPSPEQMMGQILWVKAVREEQVAQMTVLVNDSLAQLQRQANHVAALQEQVANRKPGRRALNALRKVLS
jgi:hypothetical protein